MPLSALVSRRIASSQREEKGECCGRPPEAAEDPLSTISPATAHTSPMRSPNLCDKGRFISRGQRTVRRSGRNWTRAEIGYQMLDHKVEIGKVVSARFVLRQSSVEMSQN